MNSQDKERNDFETATGWFEDTEGLNLGDLREIRRIMGHDVEASEKRFLAFLGTLPGATASAARPFGILSRAKAQGRSIVQLANAAELSVALIAKLDLRLFRFASVPIQVIGKLCEVLAVSVDEVSAYLQQGAAFAPGAEYRADEAPSLPDQQDFFEAVSADKTLSEQRREHLLGLRPK